MELIKKLIELAWYYELDSKNGKPYWRDPTIIGLAVGIAATEYAKYCGVVVSTDLQLKIVGTITGIGALLSPHTGVVAKKPDPATEAKQVAKDVQEHNLTSLS